MRLAEALAQRKDKANSITRDFAENALDVMTFEDDGEHLGPNLGPTPDAAQAVLDDISATAEEIARLSININYVNNAVSIDGEWGIMPLMEAICRRDALAREIAALNGLIQSVESAVGAGRSRRYGYSRGKDDITIKPVIPLSVLRDHRDSKSAALRRLDIEIQKVNWTEDIDRG